MIFAQDIEPETVWLIAASALITLYAMALAIVICYLLTLQKALSRVSPPNRLMAPGLVWLVLIPCFNVIWQFFIASRVPDSLRNEFRARNRDNGSDYGKSMAMTQAVLNTIFGVWWQCSNEAVLPELSRVAAGVSAVIGIISLILFIVFWVKIAGYSRQLAEDSGPPRDWERKFDDDDDGFGNRGPYTDAPKPPPDAIKEGDPGHYQ